MLFVPHDLKLRMQEETPRVVRSADEIESILNTAGLRPTRQRMTLWVLLFGSKHRHVTADGLHQEALGTGASPSLATVYNALDGFTDAGLLRYFAASPLTASELISTRTPATTTTSMSRRKTESSTFHEDQSVSIAFRFLLRAMRSPRSMW